MTTDKVLLRAKDITLMIAIVTLLGAFFGPFKKIIKMEDTIEKVEKLEDRVGVQATNIAVISSQYADITRQLEQINSQLRRMRDGR